ncbi:MAG TPA: ABC transporter permease, partial [Acidimicrobiales bacterium]|nr:ABC transporter permease [Acidimicrobiales bacterium]
MTVVDPTATTGTVPVPAQVSGTPVDDLGVARPLRADVWRRFRRNKLAMVGIAFVILLVLAAIFAPLITSYTITERSDSFRQGPTADHWFGTDQIGRDVYTRVVYGARVSLRIGILATVLILFIGVTLGALAGFFGGWGDTVITRLVDVFLAIPYIVLAVAIASVFGKSENAVTLVLGLTGWLALSRIVRSSFLSLRQLEYVEAARALGFSRARIMFRHI